MRRNEAQTLLDEMVELHRQIAVKEMEIAQLQDRLNGIREGILSAFMEDAVPNSVPEDVPPVTDMEEVKKRWRARVHTSDTDALERALHTKRM